MRLERTSFGKRLSSYTEAIQLAAQPVVEGRLLRMVGLTLEAEGLRAAMGSRCVVINDDSMIRCKSKPKSWVSPGPRCF